MEEEIQLKVKHLQDELIQYKNILNEHNKEKYIFNKHDIIAEPNETSLFLFKNSDHEANNVLVDLFVKCYGMTYIKHKLIQYEIKHLKLNFETISREELIELVNTILLRYKNESFRLGLEDSIWKFHDLTINTNIKRYDLKENEILFENSIPIALSEGKEFIDFIEHLTTLFQSISIKIKVKNIMIDDPIHSIVWVLFKIDFI
jgi:hypothetical protein